MTTTLLTLSLLAASTAPLTLHDSGGDRAATYLRFVLHSKKAGLFETTVEGHVNEFAVSYDWTGEAAKSARVGFAARDMRTDNGSRDDKMWGYCLDAEHHPRVEVQLDGDVPLGKARVPGRINVRGAWHPVELSTELRRSGAALVLSGTAAVRLSELGIPDPSIWIAKVDDKVELDFRVTTSARM